MTVQHRRFRLLGPLEIEVDGRTVRLTGRQRALCGVLLLDANKVVSVENIVRSLWEHPPAAGEARVRSLVAEVRRTVGPAGAEALMTRNPGYVMCVESGQLDVYEFEELVRLGSRAAAHTDWTGALRSYDRALALWRGEPLPDLPSAPERRRFEELRTAATEGGWRPRWRSGTTPGPSPSCPASPGSTHCASARTRYSCGRCGRRDVQRRRWRCMRRSDAGSWRRSGWSRPPSSASCTCAC